MLSRSWVRLLAGRDVKHHLWDVDERRPCLYAPGMAGSFHSGIEAAPRRRWRPNIWSDGRVYWRSEHTYAEEAEAKDAAEQTFTAMIRAMVVGNEVVGSSAEVDPHVN